MVLVACGWRHTIFVTSSGGLYTYGWSKNGQLGHGDFEDHLVPHKLDALHEFFISETNSEFDAKPMVMLLGQYSTGKTNFIKHLLKCNYLGAHIVPEPTTDRFVVVMRQLYEAFLNSEIVLSAFDGSPLATLTVANIIREDLWPNPLTYFNNEADEEDFDGDEDDEEGKEDGSEEDDDEQDDEEDDEGEEDNN